MYFRNLIKSNKVQWQSFPGKDKYDLYVEFTKELMTVSAYVYVIHFHTIWPLVYRKFNTSNLPMVNRLLVLQLIESRGGYYYAELMDVIGQQFLELSASLESAMKHYEGTCFSDTWISNIICSFGNCVMSDAFKIILNVLVDAVSRISKNQLSEYIGSKYDSLLKTATEYRVPDIASQYTNAIYDVRDQISSRMNGPVLATIKEAAGQSYHLVRSYFFIWSRECFEFIK